MIEYVARRLLAAVPVVFGVSVISFLMIRLIPGDPVSMQMGTHMTLEAHDYWINYYGLNQPLPVQYVTFLARAVSLDFGESIVMKDSVSMLLASRLGPTLALMTYAIVASVAIMVPLATYSAVKAGRWQDNVIKYGTMVTYAMPAFWIGIELVQVFALRTKLLPATGIGDGWLGVIGSLTLPAFTIVLYLSPALTRTLRATMISLLQAEHVEAARARGLSEARVLRRYVLRNSLTATVTLLGLNIGFLIGGSIVVENVFAIPGIGQLLVGSVAKRDFPVVQACVLLIGVAVVLVNLVVDLVNAFLDPRVRRGAGA